MIFFFCSYFSTTALLLINLGNYFIKHAIGLQIGFFKLYKIRRIYKILFFSKNKTFIDLFEIFNMNLRLETSIKMSRKTLADQFHVAILGDNFQNINTISFVKLFTKTEYNLKYVLQAWKTLA